MLVGIKDNGRVRTVREGMVKKTIELLDKCMHFLDVTLDQRSANEVFAASCQVAMATFSAYTVPGSYPIFPSRCVREGGEGDVCEGARKEERGMCVCVLREGREN